MMLSPPKPRAPRRRQRSPQAVHLTQTLQNLWQDYRAAHRRCQRHCGQSSVHGLRVATRRLMAHLDLLAVILNAPAVGKARRILRKRLKSLAELRDGQVQLNMLTAKIRSFPEMRPLQLILEKSERRDMAAAAKELSKDRNEKLRKQLTVVTSRLAAALEFPEEGPRHRAAIKQALQARLHQAVQRQRVAGQEPAAIHRTRVSMKKYRYLIEAVRPMLPHFDEWRFRRLADFQEVTGELHDISVLLTLLGSMVAKKKLEVWRTHRFREILTRRRTALMVNYSQLTRELFARRAEALQFAL